MSYFAIEIEPDDGGFHAVVVDEGDGIAHVSNTYATPADAERAARSWIDRRQWPASA